MPPKKKVVKPAAKRMPSARQRQAARAPVFDVSDAVLDASIIEAGEIQTQMAILKERDTEVRRVIVAGLDERGLKSHKVQNTNATMSERSSTTINEEALKKRLGAALWAKVTTRVLDGRKLKAYIAAGDIDSTVVAQASSTTVGDPFVIISKK